jgi:hypothetical protein
LAISIALARTNGERFSIAAGTLPDDAVFCGHCGNPLHVTGACARCGRANPAGMCFCLGCGQPAASSAAAPRPKPRSYTFETPRREDPPRSALEGERKQVTVLFADVKGSMDLSESIDPGDWHRIMDRFFAILSEGVHRFEGTINQYTGDGIMALFGAPIAHEDHARRACYAALPEFALNTPEQGEPQRRRRRRSSMFHTPAIRTSRNERFASSMTACRPAVVISYKP